MKITRYSAEKQIIDELNQILIPKRKTPLNRFCQHFAVFKRNHKKYKNVFEAYLIWMYGKEHLSIIRNTTKNNLDKKNKLREIWINNLPLMREIMFDMGFGMHKMRYK